MQATAETGELAMTQKSCDDSGPNEVSGWQGECACGEWRYHRAYVVSYWMDRKGTVRSAVRCGTCKEILRQDGTKLGSVLWGKA